MRNNLFLMFCCLLMAGLINASTNNFSKGEKSVKTILKIPKAPKPKFEIKSGVISGASVVCLNSTLQLSHPSLGGTWSSSDVNFATVSATGLVTGLQEGTVTISYTFGGNSDTKLITVSGGVSLPELTFTGSTTLCIGASLQLSNATNGGVWDSSDPSVATVSTNGLITALQPCLNPVTIDYYLSDPNGCGDYDVSVDIVVQNCNGYVQCARPEQEIVDDIDKNIILPHGFYAIPKNITVKKGASLMVLDAEIIMGDGVRIYVDEGATLVLAGCHVYSCANMWKGIEVAPKGKVMITGTNNHSSLIEDAELAIDMQMKFITDVAPRNSLEGDGNEEKPMPPDPGCNDCPPVIPNFNKFLQVDNTIFNRNNVSISIGQYRALVDPDKEYPFQIKNTIFTCREIQFVSGSIVWPDVYSFKNTPILNYTTYPETPNTPLSPYIDERNYSSYVTAAFLKNQSNSKSSIGIRLIQVGNTYQDNEEKPSSINIGYSEPNKEITNKEAKFNDNRNIFDNMTDYGIYAVDTYLKVVNNTFQNGYINAKTGTTSTEGIYVIRKDLNDESPYNLSVIRERNEVPTNAFYNMYQAIESRFYLYNTVESAVIRSNKRLGLNDNNGEKGIFIQTSDWKKININSNSLVNLNYPVWASIDDLNKNSPNYDGSIDITNNWITTYKTSQYPAKTGFESVNTGITLLCSYYRGKDLYKNRVNCVSNAISAYNGIKISNFRNKLTSANYNLIAIDNDDDFNVKEQFGILMEGGELFNSTQQSTPNEIINNHINDYSVTIATFPPKLSAIKLNLQNSTDVTCNEVGFCQNGLHFIGYNDDVKCWDNVFENTLSNGLVLDNNGYIGAQGGKILSGTCASDNSWGGDWTNKYKTACINSDASFSPLYIDETKGLDYDPDGFGNVVGFSVPYSHLRQSLFGIPQVSGNCAHCVITLKQPNNPNTTSALSRTKQANNIQQKSNFKYEEAIALGTLSISTPDSAQMLYVMQQRLYASLWKDTTKLYNSNTLFGFAAANAYSNIGLFYAIDTLLAKNDTFGVYGILSSINSNNTVDAHYLAYYQWLLKLKNGEAIDTNAVFDLANGCPSTDGSIVFAARNLYNSLTNSTIAFVNSCNPYSYMQSQQIVQNQPKSKVIPTSSKEILVYPNPSKGDVNIQLPFASNFNYNIFITDTYGREVKRINSVSSKTNFNIEGKSGVYLINIYNCNNGITEIKRVLINK